MPLASTHVSFHKDVARKKTQRFVCVSGEMDVCASRLTCNYIHFHDLFLKVILHFAQTGCLILTVLSSFDKS